MINVAAFKCAMIIKRSNNLTSLNPADCFIVHQPSLFLPVQHHQFLSNLLNGVTMFYRLISTGQLTAGTRFR